MCLAVLCGRRKKVGFLSLSSEFGKHPISCPLFSCEAEAAARSQGGFVISLLYMGKAEARPTSLGAVCYQPRPACLSVLMMYVCRLKAAC